MQRFLKWLGIIIVSVIAIGIGIIGVMIFISEPMPEHPFFANLPDDEFIIMAHQGGDGEYPSNTMLAFENAAEIGAHVLEMDVHMSADGVIVVIHDTTVDRTTDGTGRITEMTFEELQALDAGYNFPTLAGHELLGTGEYPFRGQGLTIPSLEEIFIAFPDMPMSIEIKQESPSMAQPLCDLLTEYDRIESTIVPSFSPIAMAEFREACPDVATAAVRPEVTMFFALNTAFIGSAWQPTTESFMIPEYQGDLHLVTDRFVNTLQNNHNVRIYPWTINDREQMIRMIELGVDGIITDYPTLALELSQE